MELSRREFLKASGAGVGSIFLLKLINRDVALAGPPKSIPLKKKIGETVSICAYCSGGCGILVGAEGNNLISIEGYPDHPINRGALCSKAQAIYQVRTVSGKLNPRRLTKVLYRAPNSTAWEEKSWDWALEQIAKRIKKTRDENFIEKEKDGVLVNRTEAIAHVGGSAHTNEEGYLIYKASRALGIVYMEQQARLCHSSTVAALAESFGRGAMTNHWTDIGNADVILIMGSNAAENHPISFHWVTKAMEKGAKLIHADPRFTRTSARADIYAPFRSGTDIAFLGGMIKYIIEDIEQNPQNYNMEYLREYTNAGWLINSGYSFSDGIFSGYDTNARAYKDKSSWQYQLDGKGIPKQDKTFKDQNCVFQLLKKHYSRYDTDTVSKVTGTPKELLLKVYQTFASTGKADRVGTIMYAMGTTQHTVGSQYIRAFSIVQLLLANVGLAGGGINAMRGHSNVQGATDHALLFHILPGYLPVFTSTDTTLAKYLERTTPKSNDPKSGNWWQHRPKYVVSLLKAWYGDAAAKDNEFGYQYLPKIQAGGNYSWIPLFEAMEKGTIKGLLCWGQNPAVCGPNLNSEHKALDKLDWLAVVDLWETETAAFWKRPGVDSKAIKTEVFLLPACASYEKEGSITNSGRWAQWRDKAIEPPGDAQNDLWIVNKLVLELKDLYRQGGPNADAITKLTWDYGDPPDYHKVAKEINGYDLNTGKLMANFFGLKDDGTTSCGNWLYSGSYTEDGNMMARRDPKDTSGIGLYSNWAWCWPVNRRILYNRASVDLSGNPWDPKRAVMKWDAAAKKWSGDVVDGFGTKGPAEVYPFIMLPEGVSRLFGMGMADGPFPEHYEPWETPVKNMMSGTQLNPAVKVWRPEEQGTPDKYPYVATTYRLTEHWQAGAMTRNLPWLVELMPEMFVEISEELATEKGIRNGERIVVESARGQVSAVAIVTKRLVPLQVDGRIIHQVGLPWHWGYMGLTTGDSANLLTPHIGDANTTIPEYKTFLVNVRRA